MLRVHGLPTLENDSVYQVWLQRDGEVIPQSMFTVGENGEGAAAVADDLEAADAVMITRERVPGRQGAHRRRRSSAFASDYPGLRDGDLLPPPGSRDGSRLLQLRAPDLH